jgi:glycosyltransferase involved in cell wall biosynthesis
MVAASMVENGGPEEKLVATSYGWSPARFKAERKERRGEKMTAIFVGTVCVRKGAHLLVEAWREAGVEGRLLLAGRIESPLKADRLQGPGVELLGHTNRVPEWMAESDIFAFPTLEEGGPLVTYEAAAMGMAILTTPMGAGAIVRDGIEGIVLEPQDRAGWADAFRRLASDDGLRRRLGEAARVRAQEFTWDKVAENRLRALKERMGAAAMSA